MGLRCTDSVAALRTTFASNVGRTARSRGLSRYELAIRSGCARSHLLEVLAGRRSIGIDHVAKVAWVLDVDGGALFAVADVTPPPRAIASNFHGPRALS